MTADELAAHICAKRGWELLQHVGSGAFKHTFQIRNGGAFFALKVYQKTPDQRSARELEAMTRCNHQNVAKLVGMDSIDIGGGTFNYVVEEFLSGGALSKRIKSVSREAIIEMALPLVSALEHIAALQLVHRDLKPDNVMFRDATNATPVIVDFGLVRNLADSSLTATWLMQGPGTPLFAAPEQLTNEKAMISWRTDQFGLGVTLAMVWSGEHPYFQPQDTPEMTVNRVASCASPSAGFVDRCRQARLEPLVRMVQAYPVHRFRTPGDLATAWQGLKTP